MTRPTRKATRRKINWLEIEGLIQRTLLEYRRGDILATEACRTIDAIVAQGTGRGASLPVEPLPWEDSRTEEHAKRTVPEWYADSGAVGGEYEQE